MNVFKLKPGSHWIAIYSVDRTSQVVSDEFAGKPWLGNKFHGLLQCFEHHTYKMANAPCHINKAHTRRHTVTDPRRDPNTSDQHAGDSNRQPTEAMISSQKDQRWETIDD